MNQIYPDQGLLEWLEYMADGGGGGLYWRLFESNTTPSLDTVLADLTLSSTSWGRAQRDFADFTLTQVAAHVGSIQAPNIVFTNTTGSTKTVYGYCVHDIAETKLLGIARFDAAPLSVLNNGTVVVTPILGDYSSASS